MPKAQGSAHSGGIRAGFHKSTLIVDAARRNSPRARTAHRAVAPLNPLVHQSLNPCEFRVRPGGAVHDLCSPASAWTPVPNRCHSADAAATTLIRPDESAGREPLFSPGNPRSTPPSLDRPHGQVKNHLQPRGARTEACIRAGGRRTGSRRSRLAGRREMRQAPRGFGFIPGVPRT